MRTQVFSALSFLILTASAFASHPKLVSLTQEWKRIDGEIEALSLENAETKLRAIQAAIKKAAEKHNALPDDAKSDPAFKACAALGEATYKRYQAKFAKLKAASRAASQGATGKSPPGQAEIFAFDKDYRTVYSKFAKLSIKDLANAEAHWTSEFDRLEQAFLKLNTHNPNHSKVKMGWDALKAAWSGAKAKIVEFHKKQKQFQADQVAEAANKLEFKDERNLKFWVKEYKRLAPSFQKIDLIKLQDPKEVENLKWKIDKLSTMLKKVSKQKNPRVVRAWGAISGLRKSVEEALKQRDEVAAKAGNVGEQLTLLKSQFSRESFRPELKKPWTAERLTTWAENLKDWELLHKEGVKFLEKARQFSLEAKTSQFNAYYRWFRDDVKRRMERSKSENLQKITRSIEASLNSYNLSESNLADEKYVQELVANMESAKALCDALNAFNDVYFGRRDARWEKAKKTLEEKRSKALGGAKAALQNARMPKADSNDATLLAKASQEIANPKHGFGKAARIVISHRLKEYQKLVWHDGGFYLRKWKQFQVAFAEEDGADYWIHYAILKFIEQGAPGDKIGKWYISGRGTFRSKKILKENIFR
jgi:hypothetical protein